MDAELKQAFDRLEEKVDGLRATVEKVESAHSVDHDKIIRLEVAIENAIIELGKHTAAECDYGKKTEQRIDSIEEKLLKYGVIITLIASSIGGGSGEIIRALLGGG